MNYYIITATILVVLLDIIILNLVWRALKGVPDQMSELSAAVSSFALIAVGVVMTSIVLSTTVEAAKLTHAIPGKHMSYTTQHRYSTVRSEHYKHRHGYTHANKRKHGLSAKRATRQPIRKK